MFSFCHPSRNENDRLEKPRKNSSIILYVCENFGGFFQLIVFVCGGDFFNLFFPERFWCGHDSGGNEGEEERRGKNHGVDIGHVLFLEQPN